MEVNKKMDIITGGATTIKYAVGSLVLSIPTWMQIRWTGIFNLSWIKPEDLDMYLTNGTRIVSILVGIAAIINYIIQWSKKKDK